MAQKRFGPTLGAGVAVVEADGDRPIQPGQLGVTAYLGVLEKGDTDKLIPLFTAREARRKIGGYIPEPQLPDSIFDFFNMSEGAGMIWVQRVTDGSEVAAEITLYNRRVVDAGSGIIRPAGVLGKLKARNGGRWGGKFSRLPGAVADVATDITAVTLNTGKAMLDDYWKGGKVILRGVAGKSYDILGNDANGVVTVAADADMAADLAAGGDPTNGRYLLTLDNDGKALAVVVKDGEDNPATEFGLDIYVDGVRVLQYPNLSTNPDSGRYWVDIINKDENNFEVLAEDLWTGSHSADVMPANYFGVSKALSETKLTAEIISQQDSVAGAGALTAGAFVYTNGLLDDTITITMLDATNFNAVSALYGALGSGVLGTPFAPVDDSLLGFTVSGTGTIAAGDTLTLVVRPFKVGELIGGRVIPDVSSPLVSYRIVDNDVDSVTVGIGSDMTKGGAVSAGKLFRIEAAMEFAGGYDGLANLSDNDYLKHLQISTTRFTQLFGKNMGLVKMAAPGVTSTAVQKAGSALAAALNYQWRYVIPSNIVTEIDAYNHVNATLGRSDHAVVAFPSYAEVLDPTSKDGKRKLVDQTGAIHGREALVAKNYNGYHKAAAGIDVTLPNVLALPTGDAVLNEEFLNPAGIQILKFKNGNCIIWGDRTLATDPQWKWKHKREQMSYYENVLRESFDWIVFAINDPLEQPKLIASLQSFFLPEFQKRALRGTDFSDAVTIKIDNENNTDLTRAAGDLNAEIKLRLADTVERFVITIGKKGIFDATA